MLTFKVPTVLEYTIDLYRDLVGLTTYSTIVIVINNNNNSELLDVMRDT